MRFLVGLHGGQKAVFAVKGEEAVNLSAAIPGLGDDLAAMISDPDLQAKAVGVVGSSVPVSDITPELPVETPPTVICLGLNYVEHIKEGG